MTSMRTDTPASTDWVLLILRLGMGLIVLPHGLQKTLGLFGGAGFAGTMQFFGSTLHLPPYIAILPIVAESLGSVLLVLGLLTRLAAFAIAFDMAVAALLVNAPNGFFMNWTGQQHGEGFEFHLLLVTIGLALIVGGGGRFSLDAAFFGRGRR